MADNVSVGGGDAWNDVVRNCGQRCFLGELINECEVMAAVPHRAEEGMYVQGVCSYMSHVDSFVDEEASSMADGAISVICPPPGDNTGSVFFNRLDSFFTGLALDHIIPPDEDTELPCALYQSAYIDGKTITAGFSYEVSMLDCVLECGRDPGCSHVNYAVSTREGLENRAGCEYMLSLDIDGELTAQIESDSFVYLSCVKPFYVEDGTGVNHTLDVLKLESALAANPQRVDEDGLEPIAEGSLEGEEDDDDDDSDLDDDDESEAEDREIERERVPALGAGEESESLPATPEAGRTESEEGEEPEGEEPEGEEPEGREEEAGGGGGGGVSTGLVAGVAVGTLAVIIAVVAVAILCASRRHIVQDQSIHYKQLQQPPLSSHWLGSSRGGVDLEVGLECGLKTDCRLPSGDVDGEICGDDALKGGGLSRSTSVLTPAPSALDFGALMACDRAASACQLPTLSGVLSSTAHRSLPPCWLRHDAAQAAARRDDTAAPGRPAASKDDSFISGWSRPGLLLSSSGSGPVELLDLLADPKARAALKQHPDAQAMLMVYQLSCQIATCMKATSHASGSTPARSWLSSPVVALGIGRAEPRPNLQDSVPHVSFVPPNCPVSTNLEEQLTSLMQDAGMEHCSLDDLDPSAMATADASQAMPAVADQQAEEAERPGTASSGESLQEQEAKQARKVQILTRLMPVQPDVDLRVDPQQDLQIIHKLGRGAFGMVYKAWWRLRDGSRRQVAVKVIDLDESAGLSRRDSARLQKAVHTEMDIMTRLCHPGIVRCYGGCIRSDMACLILEFMEGGTLDRYVHVVREENALTVQEVLAVAHHVALALSFLHPLIIHADLKPQNALLDSQGRIKLADFGLSKVKVNTLMSSMLGGTPAYIAPEVFQQQRITEKCDIYSLGVLLWECLTGERPWNDCCYPMQIMHEVQVKGVRPKIPANLPAKVQNLMQKCWHADPRQRPSASELVKSIQIVTASLEVARQGGGTLDDASSASQAH